MPSNLSNPVAVRRPRKPQPNRAVHRVTQILDAVVGTPGMSLSEVARAIDVPRSSVHAYLRGLIANGWLGEDGPRYFLGPALIGLARVGAQLPVGLVTHADLVAVHDESGLAVQLGIPMADRLVPVAEVGADGVVTAPAENHEPVLLLGTAGGMALLAARPSAECEAFLQRREANERALMNEFLRDLIQIRRTRIATRANDEGTRLALGTAVRNQAGVVVAALTVEGDRAAVASRTAGLGRLLLRHVDAWATR